jgi:hypothetical protein
MISIESRAPDLVVYYEQDNGPAWVGRALRQDGEVTLARTFTFEPADLISAPRTDEPESDEQLAFDEGGWEFRLGVESGNYYKIQRETLSLDRDVLLAKGLPLKPKHFIAHRGISIFRKIDKLLSAASQWEDKATPEDASADTIRIGGDIQPNIPWDAFEELISRFPNSTELDKYSSARIEMTIREHLMIGTEAERRYEAYLNRRAKSPPSTTLETVKEPEREKFSFLHNKLSSMLTQAEAYNEDTWQKSILDILQLLYPKYVAVIEKVPVKDETTQTDREIDIGLVDDAGHLDIIEIKKPFEKCLMSSSRYRDNHVPLRELSGTIMQCEKHLYHLNKSGTKGEARINSKYKEQLPDGLQIKILNPNAIILAGRTTTMSQDQIGDFEFVRRKYKNLIDIMTYDDLLDRLSRVIAKYS